MSSDRSKQRPPPWKEAAPSATAAGTNRNSAATIRASSPRKMKTQIAKLVYDPATTKPKRDVFVNENEAPAVTAAVVEEEFQKKRQDRDREVKEIQEMLNEITNTPTKEKRGTEVEATVVAKNSPKKLSPAIQRSKTETNLHPPPRRSQLRVEPKSVRSKSVQSKGKEVEKTTTTPGKGQQKSYNSEEARRYMQEQKKKRRSMQTGAQTEDGKAAIDKNEIKKRLDNLRKNTRQLVNKNLAKKKSVVPQPAEKNPTPQKEELQREAPKELEIRIESHKIKEDVVPKKALVEKPQDPNPLVENYKKVGLLRKPEFKDHSFSAIKDLNMDKENLILEMLTPQLLNVPTSRLNEVLPIEHKQSELILSDKTESNIDLKKRSLPEQLNKIDSSVHSSKRSSIHDLDLKVPDAKLRSHISLREKSIQVDRSVQGSSKQKKHADLPYWLKPTSAQAYPYNFIMAVRKKLDAIASPPAVASSSSSLDQQQPKRRPAETPVSYPKTNRSTNAKRRIMEYDDKSKDNVTELTSNFSSISIQLPESNDTINSLKSKEYPNRKQKQKRFQEDDTTASSSVFSSPEKKKNSSLVPPAEVSALSPLSMENISSLHIKSKSMLCNVTIDRGDQFSERSGVLSSRSEAGVDFSQLLDDFNRSLSQVIEVNQQLKSTLVKSHQIFSPEKAKRPSTVAIESGKPVELAEYVSDFEESSKRTTTNSIPEIHTASEKSSEGKTSAASSSADEAPVEESPIQSSTESVSIRSVVSLETQTFVVTSEDQEHHSPRTETIYEEAFEESPNKENMSANQYSRDSLELSPRDDYIKSHINISRGDFQYERSEPSAGPPPSYKTAKQDTPDRSRGNLANSSLDSEFVRVFNKSDLEVSMSLSRTMSESTINYSSIGLYEKLIQNENSKSEHLAALLKMREKAIIDRTKGQIAWLEVQKERYKAKGLTLQISGVKKKQRGILMKMEKEREEIKKLLQQAKVQRDQKLRIPESRPSPDVTILQPRRTGLQASAVQTTSVYQPKQSSPHLHQQHSVRTSGIVRGYELETSRSLEQLLHKREEDLRRRREHVERLMEWHRRLDQEEAEVLQLERMLLNYNNVQPQEEDTNATKRERKLKEIDRSLRELSSISSAEGSADGGGDFVRTTGGKLNKLWRRLTSRRVEKFEPNKRYKLCKADLEQLYEEAKLAVLHDFGDNAGQMEVFLEHTSISTTQQSILGAEVPQLNLNFSSGQSDADLMRGNYSPSAAEEEFIGYTGASTSDGGYSGESGRESTKRKTRSGTSSLSALPSLAGSEHSLSSHDGTRRAHISGGRSLKPMGSGLKESASDTEVNRLRSSVLSDSLSRDISTDGLSRKTETAPVGAKIISDRTSVVESRSSVPENSIKSASSESDRPNLVESAPQSVSNAQTLSEHASLSDSVACTAMITEDGKDTPASDSSVKTLTLAKSGNLSGSIVSEIAVNSVDAKTASIRTSLIESASLPQNSRSTGSDGALASSKTVSVLEGISQIGLIDKTDSERTTMMESDLSKNSTNSISTIKTDSHGSRTHSPPETALTSPSKTQTDGIRTNSRTRATNSALNASPTVSSVLSESGKSQSSTRPDSNSSQAQNRSKEGSHLSTLDHDPPENSVRSAESLKSVSNISSNQWPEDSAGSSIMKSLLSCNSGSLISESSKMLIRTNGYQRAEDSPSVAAESKEETTVTQTSINSIDKSTNSKHSPPTGVTSNDSRPESPPIESEAPYSSAFESSPAESIATISPNQQRSSVIISTGLSSNHEDASKTLSNAFYESDFTEAEESNIDDISLPKFESTGDDDEEQLVESDVSQSSYPSNRELEKRLIDLDSSLKDLNATFEKALSPDKITSPPHDDCNKKQATTDQSSDNALMPDIISEVELRRRQQVMLENEMKQFEHAVPYMYVREIPNKPPPPYVPPAHGSPMTTIFPSEERIKDITYRRTKELYCEILNIDTTDENGKKPASVLDENITNIYERIILDICKEYLTEYEPVLTSADPNNFHSALAFFNPPDRLKCVQDFIYKEVRKSLAMDKNSPRRNQVYSVYGHRGKRDHIGEIIIQEMYEEDDMWCNFYTEEAEVLDLIVEEMIGDTVRDIATKVLEEEVPRDPLEAAVESAEVRCSST